MKISKMLLSVILCIIILSTALETSGLYQNGLKYNLSEESMRFVISNQLKFANNKK